MEPKTELQRTLAIAKPDSVAAGNAGHILAHLEREGFRVLALRKLALSVAQAEAFYAVHRERPFYRDLVSFMTGGPVIPIALERVDAVGHLRRVMGDTDSRKAPAGTLRNLYGTDIQNNAVHGSDSPENAAIELGFFFAGCELG